MGGLHSDYRTQLWDREHKNAGLRLEISITVPRQGLGSPGRRPGAYPGSQVSH